MTANERVLRPEPTAETDTPAPKGAIFSVGETPEPIIQALRESPVQFVLFIVSERSEPQVTGGILPAIGYTLQWDSVRLAHPDDLNQCYQAIRAALRTWMSRRSLRSEDVYFDLTGGTKPMSAALALAAVERIPRYHYVSGERGKDGKVTSGTEKFISGRNPWIEIALRERELADHLFLQGDVAAAGNLLDHASETAPEWSGTLKTYAGLCRALSKLDAFDFPGALNELRHRQKALEVIFEERRDTQLLAWIRGLHAHLEELDRERRRQQDFPQSLLELMANARRRGRQGRYDDAISRLYRAVELLAQNRLHRAFGALSGRIPLATLEPSLAAKLHDAFPNDQVENGSGPLLRLSCAKAFAALAFSPYEGDHALSRIYDRLKNALTKRNDSWLAHGTRPASAEDFEQMWDLVLKELGITADDLPNWPKIHFTE